MKRIYWALLALLVATPLAFAGASFRGIDKTSTGLVIHFSGGDYLLPITSTGSTLTVQPQENLVIGSQTQTGSGIYRFRVDDLNLGIQVRAGSTSSHFPLTLQTAGGVNILTVDALGDTTIGSASSAPTLHVTDASGSGQIELSRTASSTGDVWVGSASGDLRVGTTAGATDLMQASASGGLSSPHGIQLPGNGANYLTFSSGPVDLYNVNSASSTTSCQSSCAADGNHSSGSGLCLGAWNSGTAANISCSDTTSISRRCLCTGLH